MLAQGLPAATKTRSGAPSAMPGVSSAIMDAAVTLNPADVHADADAAAVGADAAPAARWTGPSRPGAPHGPVPWSRRWAAVAAGGHPAGIGRGEETPARRQAHVGVRRVLVVVAEAVEVVTGRQARGGPRPFGAQHEPVGDGHAGGKRGDGVVRSRRLEDEGPCGVGDQERGVVGLVVRGVGDAALPARLEQPRHHVDRLGGGAGTLEPEADQVHADQRGLGCRRVVRRADTLVPDGDPVLVDPVLGAPEPGRAGEERRMRAGVADGEVLGAQACIPPRRGGRRARRSGPRPAGGPSSWRTPCRAGPGRTGCRTWSQCREPG